MTEREFVKDCICKICYKNGFPNPTLMTFRDFEHISQELEEKTGTLLSVSTIKRLLNGDFSRMPQTATLNAISNYLGFKNWHDYKVNSFPTEIPPAKKEVNVAGKYFIPAITPHKLLYNKWTGSVLAMITLLMIFSFISSKKTSGVSYKSANFSFKKTTANDLPNTVVFEYDVSGVTADSFFIQQSWDKTRRVRIDKDNHTLTDIYYEPGYHIAKLIANDSIIKTIDVSIPTDKWIYYAKEKSFSSRPQYIQVNSFGNGMLQIANENLEKSMVNTEKENYYVMTYFPSAIQYSSDNFILKCRAKVVNTRNTTCPSLMCEVFTQKYFNYFNTRAAGCAYEIKAQFGNHELDGKTTDLSAVAMDVNKWNDIEFSVINKTALVKLNGREVFTQHYETSSGLITGLGFISNGLAQVDYATLSTADGKIIYSNDFNKEK